jgi:glyoxylase-like metal-dependent hydrolase (beta-lactamase superfamily II)
MKRALLAGLIALCASACAPPSPTTTAQTTAPVAAEAFHRFEIGALPAVALRDGTLSEPNDGHSFVDGQPTQDVAALLSAAHLPTDAIGFSIQPLYVDAGARKLLFDTGVGAALPTGGQLPASLRAAGIDPASITDIFISHGHGDHVDGLINADGALAFPNAAIHISAAEWAHLRTFTQADASRRIIPDIRSLVAAITPKVVTFAPGATLIPGLVTAVDIRGHTPGHSAYRITSGDQSLLFIGDAFHHSAISIQRPGWRVAFDEDPATAAQSRVAFVAEAAATHQRLYGGHFPFPGLGHIEKHGEETVWVAE